MHCKIGEDKWLSVDLSVIRSCVEHYIEEEKKRDCNNILAATSAPASAMVKVMLFQVHEGKLCCAKFPPYESTGTRGKRYLVEYCAEFYLQITPQNHFYARERNKFAQHKY